MTTAPIHIGELLGSGMWDILTYVVVGFFFGVILERGGFGDAREIVAVLFFKDAKVPKVMLSAILVVMGGVYLLGAMRVFDLTAIKFTYTWVWPQLVGGIIFGLGFGLGGYCPGTAVVSMVNRKLDGLAFVLGVFAGIFAFGLVFDWFDWFAKFFTSSAMGKLSLSGIFNINPGWFMLGVVAFTLVFLGFLNRMECWFESKKKTADIQESVR